MRYLKSWLAFAILVSLLGAVSPAFSQVAGDELAQANQAAMAEYDMMEFEKARQMLSELVDSSSGEASPELAAAYLSLGVVHFSGFGDEEAALEAFKSAIQIDGQVEIDVAYATPELSRLLEQARDEAGDGAACEMDGIEHSLVDEAASGSAPRIEARLGSSVPASAMVLFFRSEGELEFSRIDMKKEGECLFAANIPTRATAGDFVHYYIAALDDGGQEVVRKGSTGSPNIIEVASSGGDGDDPLGTGTTSDDDDVADDAPTFALGFSLGSGFGYVNGPTEKTGSVVECCFAPARLHVLPELGFFLSRKSSITAGFRAGFPLGANVEGHATFAPAVLVRLRHALSEDGYGLFVSGAVGGGFIRNTVTITDAPEGMDTDTTVMGPALLGGGVGYQKRLAGALRFVAELDATLALSMGVSDLGGVVPKNGLQIDGNVGVLFAF